MHFLHHVLSALCRSAALAATLGAMMVGTATASAAAAPTLRCGWFINPTPGNAWLIDRDGEWVIGLQGGHQADGDWPTFSAARWVRDNGHYGHGCACLRLTADPHTRQVLRIDEAVSRPLAVCRRDRRLPRP